MTTYATRTDELGRNAYLYPGTNKRSQNLGHGPFKAYSGGVQVVAVKTRVGIYRAVQRSGNLSMIDELLRIVGILDPTVEWTAYRYEGLPHYLVGRPTYPTGIFFYPVIDWPSQRFSDEGRFVHKPKGW